MFDYSTEDMYVSVYIYICSIKHQFSLAVTLFDLIFVEKVEREKAREKSISNKIAFELSICASEIEIRSKGDQR